jgi:DNA-binding transcriptional LysR family regulator
MNGHFHSLELWMYRKLLPPLFTLLAFEAAGRLQSFTRAARELNMTQAAVSKQIKLLEAHLGTPLFVRANRAVHLTPEGREYLHSVVTALTHVSLATQELQPATVDRRLVVAVDHSVGALWLVPRLPALLAVMPDTTFHVVVSDAEAQCLAGEVDVAILHGEDRFPSHDSLRLFDEVVFPVCSPGYLAGLERLQSPADLLNVRLIDLEDENWTWINWRIWLTDHGVGLPATHRALTIGNYPLVLEAARLGAGVALAWQSLIEEDLAAGRLVRPLAASVRTRFGYQLAWPRTRQPSRQALAFMSWVKQQFGHETREGSLAVELLEPRNQA